MTEYGLEKRHNFLFVDVPYSLSIPLPLKLKHILRTGVRLLDPTYPYVPDFALSRYLGPARAIPLELDQAKAYLSGASFPIKEKDGIAVLSYGNLTLGFAKIVGGIAKNHYPKGLRRRY